MRMCKNYGECVHRRSFLAAITSQYCPLIAMCAHFVNSSAESEGESSSADNTCKEVNTQVKLYGLEVYSLNLVSTKVKGGARD